MKIVPFVLELAISSILLRNKRLAFVTPWTIYTMFRSAAVFYEHIVRKRNNQVLFAHDLRKNENERSALLTSFGPSLSLTHNQLCSEVFRPMIQYAWYASGYTDNHPGPFKTVPDVCFSFDSTICAVSPCDEAPFICCSWCEKPLCFSHFFLNYHFHWFLLVKSFPTYNDNRCEARDSDCSMGW